MGQLDGKMDYPMNVMMPIINMDKMLGDQLQAGLNDLKIILEKYRQKNVLNLRFLLIPQIQSINMLKQFGIEMKWGIIFSVMTLIWITMEKAVGLHDQYIDKQMIYTNLAAIPALHFVLFGPFRKKKFYHDQMDFKEGLKAGLVITVVIAILSPL